MTSITPQCVFCSRYRGYSTDEHSIVCTSFPQAIPEDILNGQPHWASRSGEMPFNAKDAESLRLVKKMWPEGAPA